ncbi:MAG: signal peptidase I [Clostridia bacterium]|nr:signal peptidase I [Clostridia bacterium]
MNHPKVDAVKRSKQHKGYLNVLEYLEMFVLCLCAILLVFSFGLRICRVSGGSMMPTLSDGQVLIVSGIGYTPRQGDIVIFHQTSDTVAAFNEPMVKRVIATEGQTVHIDFTDGIVTVDGVALTEDYIQLIYSGRYEIFAQHHTSFVEMADGTRHRIFEATVPAGHLFVMGDNRNDSSDSRTTAIGFVDERRLLGRAVLRISPLTVFDKDN